MPLLRKILILSHRYIGIPLSFMFVLWFVSAFFMIYTGGMPRITPQMRIEGASAIDFSAVNISPAQAENILGYSASSITLGTLLGRPVYEFAEPGYDSSFVYADNGQIQNTLNQAETIQVASEFLAIPPQLFNHAGTINEADQWTISNRAEMPLEKFTVDDGLGTEVYVSPEYARVSVYTTSQSRLLAWLGTIPHWLYFTSLRMNQPLWYDIVVWSSGIGCIMALLGLALGVTQFRKVRPFNLKRAIPYQGWMRWHYILGVVFGLVTLTWVFSGLLSMEPFQWNNVRGLNVDSNVYKEGELDLNAFGDIRQVGWDAVAKGEIREVEFIWLQGQPWYLASYSEAGSLAADKRDRLHQPYNIIGQSEAEKVLINATTGEVSQGFAIEQLVAKLDASITEAAVTEYEILDEFDDYYYSRQGQLPLPAIRIKFDDPLESWIYVDPAQSELLTMVHKWSRLERWLYNGLHSLDFAFWYHSRPLWDIGVLILLLGGLAGSLLGLYFALRRLKLDFIGLLNRINRERGTVVNSTVPGSVNKTHEASGISN